MARRAWGRIFLTTGFAMAVLVAVSAAADNRIFLAESGRSQPVDARTVGAGDSLILDLRMDFDDRTVGGGVLLRYDSRLLRLDGVTFDARLGDDASLRCPAAPAPQPTVACPAAEDAISFGGVATLAGQRRVATLKFFALAGGTTALGASPNHPFGDVRGGELVVVTVPEPGTIAQMAAALFVLAGLHLRSRVR